MPILLGSPHGDLTRRRFLTGTTAALLLAACGRGNNEAQDHGRPRAADGFPVTVEHKYGSTEIPAEPKRVFAAGLTDVDPILALGVKPVGLIDWYGDPTYPLGIWPWAQDALGDAKPEVLARNDDKFNFERIAALRPDLVIAQYTGMTEEEYGLMSRIAPTAAQSGEFEDWQMPWQEMTLAIGRALGRAERAQQLVASVQERFVKAREEHPEFQGATAIFAERFEAGMSYPRGVKEPRVRFLTDLGFKIPDKIAELAGDFGANLSDEQMNLLESDVLVWNLYESRWRDDLDNNPIYQQLDVAREGRDVFLEGELSGALTWSSALSLPFALDGIVPMLAAAADGDPDTEAAP